VTVSTGRSTFACVLAAAALLLTALLAMPAGAGAATIYACKKPSGTLRLVGRRTRCRRGQTKLSWNTEGPAGRNGANGSNGANGRNGLNGLNGAAGAAGAFSVIDRNGDDVGLFAGIAYPFGIAVYLPSGAVLIYDNSPVSNGPSIYFSIAFYKQAGCAGQPYVVSSGLPFETPLILQNPPAPGSAMYFPTTLTPESFTYQSFRTSSGCTNSTGTANPAYPVEQDGVVPIVQEPLRLVPNS
jgi:hypothetical protein